MSTPDYFAERAISFAKGECGTWESYRAFLVEVIRELELEIVASRDREGESQ